MAPAVIIIGFMGSGKTVVGSRLAASLEWDFIDTDREVERRMGMSIPQAFVDRGEEFFRRHEQEVILGLLDDAPGREKGMVMSLGGGAVTISAVQERLEQEPLVFLLDEDVDTAFSRARGGSRPLARDRSSFRALFDERSYIYRLTAGFVVDTRGKDADSVTLELAELVRERMKEG